MLSWDLMFFKDTLSFSRCEWSGNRLSHWVILVLSFQFCNMVFLAMVSDINMNGLRCLGVCNVMTLPSNAMMGHKDLR